MESAAQMDNEQIISMAVSVGKIESTVTEIKENTNRRLGNVEQSVMTLADKQDAMSTIQNGQAQEISGLKSAISTSYKWMTALVTVIGIVVGVIMSLVTG